MKKVTMIDIAEKAGVSPAAVSRYINKSGYVSAEKAELIRSAIEELNFYTSAGNETNGTICLISTEALWNSFYQILWSTFITETQKNGRQAVIVSDPHLDNRSFPACVERLKKSRPDGIILAGFLDTTMSQENIQLLQSINVPVVMFERIVGTRCFNSVTFDEKQVMADAVEFLVRLGHKRIGLIGMNPTYDVEMNRETGYKNGMIAAGLEPVIQHCISYSRECGRNAAHHLISGNPDITALLICSDILASGVLQAMKERNLESPENISIISHDDGHAEFLIPRLSSIHYPMEQAVNAALSILNQQIGVSAACPVMSTRLGLSITHRDSEQSI